MSSQPTTVVAADASPSPSSGNGYYDVNVGWIPTQPLRTAVSYCYPFCYRVLGIMEGIGGVIVNTFGLNQSRFQYAVDEFHRRERVKKDREELRRKRARERFLERASRGADELDEEDDEEMDDEYDASLMETEAIDSRELGVEKETPEEVAAAKLALPKRSRYVPPYVPVVETAKVPLS